MLYGRTVQLHLSDSEIRWRCISSRASKVAVIGYKDIDRVPPADRSILRRLVNSPGVAALEQCAEVSCTFLFFNDSNLILQLSVVVHSLFAVEYTKGLR